MSNKNGLREERANERGSEEKRREGKGKEY